jgi:hypothetical protein
VSLSGTLLNPPHQSIPFSHLPHSHLFHLILRQHLQVRASRYAVNEEIVGMMGQLKLEQHFRDTGEKALVGACDGQC